MDDLKAFPKDYGFVVEELQKLEQSENPVESKVTNSNKFAVDSTEKKGKKSDKMIIPRGASEFVFPNGEKGVFHSDGNYQVHSVKGLSKTFKSNSEAYNGLFKPSHLSKQKDSKGDKKKKLPSMTTSRVTTNARENMRSS